ncbi:glycosyltransferase family 4 protein [Acinetobacter terrae]|uniref:Glycosyltransferase family 4 protein n=1 Tax=Acinetobacter terrae TaxID=2731247 RepID=A0A8E4H5F8_9GAMM|nr:glycosyltransferase family 4 protein [Acinetobacter terrae]NNH38933.1 glycosyltransferase family 4 protein [Acinetobacter terrae]
MFNLKILLIGPLPDPINGCSLANQTFLEYLKKQNNCQIKTINTNTDPKIQGVQGQFNWIKLFGFIKVYFEIYKIFIAKNIYMTPGQSFWGVLKYAPFIMLAWLLKKPIIMHIHGNYLGTQYQLLSGIKKKIFKFLVSRSSAGIVLSRSLHDNFNGLLTKDKIYIVENFANDELISSEVIRKNSDQLKLLWLSNLMEEKGILYFLDALILLKNRNVPFEVKLAGKIEDGLEQNIHQKLTELGESAEYLGVVYGEQKKAQLLAANVFVFPTYYTMEGQPISLIEAMATGNIIVTTDHAGIPDIVGSENGYLLKPRDIASLVDQLENIANNLHQDIEKFSEFNQAYVKHNFTEEVFGQKIMNIIVNISNPKA